MIVEELYNFADELEERLQENKFKEEDFRTLEGKTLYKRLVGEFQFTLTNISAKRSDAFKKALEKLTNIEVYTKGAKIVREGYYFRFFILLFSHIEVYTIFIVEKVLETTDRSFQFEFRSKFLKERNPTKTFEVLFGLREIVARAVYEKAILGRTWLDTIGSFTDTRKYMEKFNVATIDALTLEKKFPGPWKRGKIAAEELLKQGLDLKEETVTYLTDLLVLIEIGKDCYGYLAVIDFILADYVEKQTKQ